MRPIASALCAALVIGSWGCTPDKGQAASGSGGTGGSAASAGGDGTGAGGTGAGGDGAGGDGAGGGGAGYSGPYTDLARWACHPDAPDNVCAADLTAVEVLANGSTAILTHTVDASPAGDCFFVYGTVDLKLQPGNHDDLSDDTDARRTSLNQAARFSERCRVYVPLYRQATLGAYLQEPSLSLEYFDIAYGDVLDAFEYYLAEQNEGRNFVLIGHSQGAQILSRLVRERLEPDPSALARMAGVFPIGWPVATDNGGSTGGSFATVPVCSAAGETGCAMSYRSYATQNGFIPDTNREGDLGICVHANAVATGGPALLSRSYLPSDIVGAGAHPPGVAAMAPFVLYRDLYTAECMEDSGSKALALDLAGLPGDQRSSPLDFDKVIFKGPTGTHAYDVHMLQGDLIDRAADMLDNH